MPAESPSQSQLSSVASGGARTTQALHSALLDEGLAAATRAEGMGGVAEGPVPSREMDGMSFGSP